MDNADTIKKEPFLELDDTVVKEELIISYEHEEDMKMKPSLDYYTGTIVKEETVVSHNLVENLKEETSSDHKEGEQEPVVEDHSNSELSCDLCDFKVSSEDGIQDHYLHTHAIGASQRGKPGRSSDVKKDKKHKCPHCDYRSYLIAHVKRHVMIHTGETPYSCPCCLFKTRDTSTLARHIRTQHENKSTEKSGRVFVCDQCSFSVTSKRWLTRHQLTIHHDLAKNHYECPHCHFRCVMKDTFTNHVLLHNGIASQLCQLCDYKTNIPAELHKHMLRKHTDLKPFECTECNYRTNCRSDLSKHSVVHKNVRPYSCSRCDYKCKRRGHLIAHQSVHDKDARKYTCPFCKYKTLNITGLKIHVRKHTGEKPYECDKCDAKYTSSAGLKAHAFSHLKSWSQSCSICEFTTDKPQVFRSHVKSHDRSNKKRWSQRKNKLSSPNTDEDVSSSE